MLLQDAQICPLVCPSVCLSVCLSHSGEVCTETPDRSSCIQLGCLTDKDVYWYAGSLDASKYTDPQLKAAL